MSHLTYISCEAKSCQNNRPTRLYPSGFAHARGFTLIELMVVVVILSIFAAMMSLSVSSTESRKNRAFYDHFIDSLEYVRLLSNEQMQPMGVSFQADNQGQLQPVIVKLDNAYAPFEQMAIAGSMSGADATPKSAMELSAPIDSQTQVTPTWTLAEEVELPSLPKDVDLVIVPLETNGANQQKTLQPWFKGNAVPKAVWFGTGGAAPVQIEIRHDKRLIGEVITITPDGRLVVGDS